METQQQQTPTEQPIDAQAAAGAEPTLKEATPTERAPKVVTEDVLEAKLAEVLRRVKQSDRDRSKAIDDKLNAIKTRLESGGGQLTAQQVSALREQIEVDMTPPDEMPQQQQQTAQPAQGQADVEQFDRALGDVWKMSGVEVKPGDVEWATIQKEWDNPQGSQTRTIAAALQAAQAKAARLKQQTDYAAARAVSGGGAMTGEAPAGNARDYWRNAYKK